MSDLRDVGAVPHDYYSGPKVSIRDFVRFDLPGGPGPGTIRYTNHPGGFVGDIDGSSQTWVHFDVKVGPIANGAEAPLSSPTISLSNVKGYWSGLARTLGLKRVPAFVFHGVFDDTGLIDSYPFFIGRISAQRGGSRFQMTLSPYTAQMAHSSPSEATSKLCGYIYREPDTCQFAGLEPAGQVTCDHTRGNGCTPRANLLNWGGEDLMPDPNKTYHWSKVARALPSHPAAAAPVTPGPTNSSPRIGTPGAFRGTITRVPSPSGQVPHPAPAPTPTVRS